MSDKRAAASSLSQPTYTHESPHSEESKNFLTRAENFQTVTFFFGATGVASLFFFQPALFFPQQQFAWTTFFSFFWEALDPRFFFSAQNPLWSVLLNLSQEQHDLNQLVPP